MLLVVLAFTCVLGKQFVLSETIREKLPYLLEKLCPGANICRENSSTFTEEEETKSKYSSCCSDCSCEPDCGIFDRCCFEDTAWEKDGNFGEMVVDKGKKRQCLYLHTGKPLLVDPTLLYSFDVESPTEINGLANRSAACESKIVAPWGSLHPVFSHTTGKIYYNSHCAELDDVSETIEWKPALVCNHDRENTAPFDISVFMAGFDQGHVPSYCRIEFTYPGNFEDIKHKVCYLELISTCTNKTFEVPYTINSTKEEIVEACKSGLVAPYHANNIYANVFCFICSGSSFVERMCDFPELERGPGKLSFMAFLDMHTIREINPAMNAEETSPVVCPQRNQLLNASRVACRPVLCPTGQIFFKGQCKFPTKTWLFNEAYTVTVYLESDQLFNVTDVFNIRNNTSCSEDDLAVLKSPFSTMTSLIRSYYEVSSLDQLTKALIVVLGRFDRVLSPALFIEQINRSMSGSWKLVYKNKSLTLKSSFLRIKGASCYTFKSCYFRSAVTKINETSTIVSSTWKLFYSKYATVLMHAIPITKLLFCNQVKLEPDEYILSENDSVLYNKIGNKYLLDAEFTFSLESTNKSVRVCLDDSGFRQLEGNHGRRGCFLDFQFVVLAILLKEISYTSY